MLNEKLRVLRKKAGYSQEQMVRKLHLTQGAISQWENGLTVPAADQLASLASIFGISVDDLLEIEKPDTSFKYEAESKGRGFESPRARHRKHRNFHGSGVFLCKNDMSIYVDTAYDKSFCKYAERYAKPAPEGTGRS